MLPPSCCQIELDVLAITSYLPAANRAELRAGGLCFATAAQQTDDFSFFELK
jgi:hypothetical protein